MIETQDMLVRAVDEALETMAFMTLMPIDEDMKTPVRTMLATMHFSGPRSGSIEILAGVEFAEIVAENIGAMDEVTDAMRCDAMKEVSNVACGLLIPMIADSASDVFDLSVPDVQIDDTGREWNEFTAQSTTVVSNVEGYAVATRLTTNE